jgi:hypothetical protein
MADHGPAGIGEGRMAVMGRVPQRSGPAWTSKTQGGDAMRQVTVKGYKLDPKTGKLVRVSRPKDVAARMRERGSKRVRVVKPGVKP